MIPFIQLRDWLAAKLRHAVKLGCEIVVSGSGIAAFALIFAPHDAYAGEAVMEQSVTFSAVSSGSIYICRPYGVKLGADRLVHVLTARIEKGQRSTYVLPVFQAVNRYPFRWRLHRKTLYFVTSSLGGIRQDQFSLHRVPVECLPPHEVSLLPRREAFGSEMAFENRLWVAVHAAADKRLYAWPGLAIKNAVPMAPYSLERHFQPILASFPFSKDELLSYDIVFRGNDSVECFVSNGRTFAAWTAKLKMQEIGSTMVAAAPETWMRVVSEPCDSKLRAWIFRSGDGFIFISESGELFNYREGETSKANGEFTKESPIVCIVGDADKDRVFAFSRQHYVELKSPLRPRPYALSPEPSDTDRLMLARRCARILVKAGELTLPAK